MSQCWKRPNIRPANPSWTRRFLHFPQQSAPKRPTAILRFFTGAVHDAVIETAEYDYALSNYIDTVNSAERMGPEYTAYGALVEGSTVCYGYASAFKLLCDRLDLPCWSVGGTSEGIGHQWNIVRLDGENYIVDCTWDDTTGTDNYFLCPVDSPDYQIDDTSLYGW